MTALTKGALAAAVLVLAVIVALLPRDNDPGGSATITANPDLGAARARAALPPCPAGDGRAGALPAMGEVAASCLGDGAPVDLATALAGRTTLVNLWATWCEPCKTELPVLAAYAAQPGAANVLTVQGASSAADGLELLTRLGVHLPVVHDGDGQTGPVRTALRAPARLPASFLVTPDGQVRLIGDPPVFETPDQVRRAVTGSP
ncbi:TlpA family protein disulfide reductase [Amycolatopsis nigrescens]|uniref:TlpA family protein disulfide reductase n=1 Tax=Amycolatopsis nigrescens TaxID=381445 RepID=UPI00036C515C|nr:TlpA disulfide reductase family protein [Amycolatopsis nigrescens]